MLRAVSTKSGRGQRDDEREEEEEEGGRRGREDSRAC